MRLAARLFRLEEDADKVAGDLKLLLEDLERVLGPDVSKRRAAGAELRKSLARKQEDLELTRHGQKWQAAAGVVQLEAPRQWDGSYEIKIDGKTPFRLAARLGFLLNLLAADKGPSHDEFVGWKSVSSLQKDLAEQFDQVVTPPALRQLIYRLRRELQRYSNPEFLQTDRARGYRFLKRP